MLGPVGAKHSFSGLKDHGLSAHCDATVCHGVNVTLLRAKPVIKRGIDLRLAECRDYGFKDQITRSGLSIPLNIAEGMERSTPADQCKFLDYARASCGECRTQAIVGIKVGFIAAEVATPWCRETKQLSAMIQGLIRLIRSRA